MSLLGELVGDKLSLWVMKMLPMINIEMNKKMNQDGCLVKKISETFCQVNATMSHICIFAGLISFINKL